MTRGHTGSVSSAIPTPNTPAAIRTARPEASVLRHPMRPTRRPVRKLHAMEKAMKGSVRYPKSSTPSFMMCMTKSAPPAV